MKYSEKEGGHSHTRREKKLKKKKSSLMAVTRAVPIKLWRR